MVAKEPSGVRVITPTRSASGSVAITKSEPTLFAISIPRTNASGYSGLGFLAVFVLVYVLHRLLEVTIDDIPLKALVAQLHENAAFAIERHVSRIFHQTKKVSFFVQIAVFYHIRGGKLHRFAVITLIEQFLAQGGLGAFGIRQNVQCRPQRPFVVAFWGGFVKESTKKGTLKRFKNTLRV